jgi:hypothetical protein
MVNFRKPDKTEQPMFYELVFYGIAANSSEESRSFLFAVPKSLRSLQLTHSGDDHVSSVVSSICQAADDRLPAAPPVPMNSTLGSSPNKPQIFESADISWITD